jgi:DNA (cytosine-5)-methyltransferase 1
VPQRRRRVFVVGHIGDWRSAAAVLLESEGLSGNTGQSKKKRKEATRDTGASSCFDMRGFGDYGNGSTSSTLKARDYKDATDLVVFDAYNSLDTGLVTKTLDTGSDYPHVPIVSHPFAYSKSHRANGNVDVRFTEDGKANTLSCGEGCGNQSSLNIVATHSIQYGERSLGKSQNGLGVSEENSPMFTLTRQDVHAVGLIYPYNQITSPHCRSNPKVGDAAPTLMGSTQAPLYTLPSVIRRLTPMECERLQGFPDNHTNIVWKGKPAPASLRYKAIGNSMAVPVMAWIGKRIDFVQRFNNAEKYL